MAIKLFEIMWAITTTVINMRYMISIQSTLYTVNTIDTIHTTHTPPPPQPHHICHIFTSKQWIIILNKTYMLTLSTDQCHWYKNHNTGNRFLLIWSKFGTNLWTFQHVQGLPVLFLNTCCWVTNNVYKQPSTSVHNRRSSLHNKCWERGLIVLETSTG